MSDRQVRVVPFRLDILARFLLLPETAKIREVVCDYDDRCRRQMRLIVESPDFSEVPEGTVPKEVVVIIKTENGIGEFGGWHGL